MINANDVVGLIPAAGKGVRLGLPYPKELYPIIRNNRYKPVTQFVLENLTASGVEHVVFVINETKHQLIGYFGDGSRFGCSVSYVFQEKKDVAGRSTSPGLARALDSAYHLVRGRTVLFGMADTIMTPKNVFSVLLSEADRDDDVVLGLYPTATPEKFGMVRFDSSGRVLRIVDKPQDTDLEYMWGCILWGPAFTEHLHDCIGRREIVDFARVMNTAIDSKLQFLAVRVDGSYLDLGTYEEILALDKRLRRLNW